MCQGCEDFFEFERAVDAYIAEVLPSMLGPEPEENLRILRGETA